MKKQTDELIKIAKSKYMTLKKNQRTAADAN